ncbi:MAG: methylated-DNA--[protein]-cysteine S-methyltransferase [Clostridiales bacterium]|nr:methylated-DNA--[protein]-cysteine S-methyltransferase [Clostridiales bacterium]
MEHHLTACEFDTPFGKLRLTACEDALVELLPFWMETRCLKSVHGTNEILFSAKKELQEYFAGERRVFTVPLKPKGTAFQKRVWQQLCAIPYGAVCNYGEIAARMGQPRAARAVGMANNRNPIMIMIPCHRVIGKNGSLVGYAGGLGMKEALLRLEGSIL